MSRIAVVDDEKNIREVIRIALERENHVVQEYADGLAAWQAFRRELPDLVILDIMMPRMDGLELCGKLKSLPCGARTPVIFLSSRDEEIDRVLGLESGGDDYVCKPFSLRELLARIHAALRRENALNEPVEVSGQPALSRGALILDGERCRVSWRGAGIEVTVTELRILASLASQPGVIKTRGQIMAAAFPEDSFPNDRAADSHIKRIRKKFTDADPSFAELEAVYGLGYRWREESCPPGDGANGASGGTAFREAR
jgi:DNA-binding response OmpR family regulator